MYIALREMNVRMPDCSVVAVAPGQPIPNFENWLPWTRKAMLEGGQVRWSDTGTLKPHEREKSARKVVQHRPRGPMGQPSQRPTADVVKLHTPGTSAGFLQDIAPEGVHVKHGIALAAEQQVDDAYVTVGDLVDNSAPPIAAGLQPTAAAPMPTQGDGRVQTDKMPTNAGAHDCLECGRQGFKTYASLKTHQARAHKGV